MATERKATPNKKKRNRRDRFKETCKNNWKPVAVGAGVTVVTVVGVVVLKRVIFPNHALLAKKIVIKDSVLLIRTYSSHQGPPSWMVRSGRLTWRSQKAAAKAAGVSESTMSRHLRGIRPHINGRIYERAAIEVGRQG